MRYRTIVADPPWDVKRGSQYAWRRGRPSGERQRLDYDTMNVEAIAALEVAEQAADNACLFLWTTQGFIRPAFEVMEAWGFTYSCVLAWCKEPHGWGPGGDFQSTVEFVMYGRRGKGRDGCDQIPRQWWTWPRGAHSAKPDAFLDMVEDNFSGPYLELFARRARFGWDYWGDESLETLEIPAA